MHIIVQCLDRIKEVSTGKDCTSPLLWFWEKSLYIKGVWVFYSSAVFWLAKSQVRFKEKSLNFASAFKVDGFLDRTNHAMPIVVTSKKVRHIANFASINFCSVFIFHLPSDFVIKRREVNMSRTLRIIKTSDVEHPVFLTIHKMSWCFIDELRDG